MPDVQRFSGAHQQGGNLNDCSVLISVTGAQIQSLPPASEIDIARLTEVQDALRLLPQIEVLTEHILHGGIYTRTIRMKPGTYVMGAHYKVASTVVLSGNLWAFVGSNWKRFEGFNVIAASKGRKQLFATPYENTEDAVITMSFRTDARTVQEAEEQMTDEHELLMSRRSDGDSVLITEEA